LHLAEPTKFKGGDKVTKGQFLGNYGETGFISGAHMHLDIINGVSGRIIDPLVFFQLMGYTI
jgi:murein DD-endopeptidase MepM/ murein hydrolase activator NlpD